MSDYLTPNGSHPTGQPAEEQLERLISALQADQHPLPPEDLAPEDIEAMQMAALLRGTLSGDVMPSSSFARNLRDQLERELFPPEVAATPAPAPVAPPQPMPPRRAGTSRRNLMRTGLAAAAGLAAGVAGGALIGQHNESEGDIPLVSSNGVWQTVAQVAQIPLGGVFRFATPQLVGHVLHYQDGTFAAFSAACTHMGCIVAWNSGQRAFDCPCHNGRFNDHGQSSGRFLYKPLPSIQVRVQGEEVQVFVPPNDAGSSTTPTATPDGSGGYGHARRGSREAE